MENKSSQKAIGKRIRALREKNNETQKKLAQILSTVQNNISKIEKGQSGITLDKLLLIATHYNVSLDYLCKGEGGVDLLDILTKYIYIEYSLMNSAYDKQTHLIPSIKINESLFNYLSRVAQAKSSKFLDEDMKQVVFTRSKENFTDNIINDTYSKYVLIIPLEIGATGESQEVFEAIEKHTVDLDNPPKTTGRYY